MGNGTSSTALRDHFSRLFAPAEEDSQENWKQLFSLPGSIQDVFEAVFSSDIEKLLLSHSDYIALFLRKAVDVLTNPLNPEADVSVQVLEKLNSLRYITRIMPVVLQHQGDSSVQDLLWSPDNHLALDLVSALLNSAFSAGFTCVQNDYEETQRLGGDAELIWYPGLVVPKVSSMGYALDDNRIEVIRCMLACCCEDIYTGGEAVAGHRNLWVWLFTCKEMPHTSALCFSLINAVVTFNPETGFMPILNYSNVSQEMAMTSAQLLTVFLHTEVPSVEEIQASSQLQQILSFLRPTIHAESTSDDESGHNLPTPGTNICVEAVQSLKEEADFQVLFECINRLLSLKRELGMEEEVLMLAWELCSLNPALVHYIAGQSEVKRLYKNLLYLMWASLDDQALTGLLQLTSFILLLLSSGNRYLERQFSVQLSTLYTGDLGLTVPQGISTLFDLLIHLTHKLLVAKVNLNLCTVLLTILVNVSCFVKTIGTLASVDLVGIFRTFSHAKTLSMDVAHLQIVRSVLEVINNRIQYHWDVGFIQGSVNLVYAILMKKEEFGRFLELRFDGETEGIPNVQMEQWHRRLPLDSVRVLLRELDPKVERLVQRLGQVSDTDILALFQKTTLVGLLPVPPAILLQRFHNNPTTYSWVLSYLWAVVYMKHQHIPLFDYSAIKLFGIRAPVN